MANASRNSATMLPEEVDKIIAQLSLKEKVYMLSGNKDFFTGFSEFQDTDTLRTKPFSAAVCERLGVPGLHFLDGPRGIVLYGGATCFPVSMARGATWDPELEERIGEAMGKELRALGGNLFGGICVNLLRHPAWGRAQETFGEDPLHVGEMAAGLVRGVERHGIACVKHFAANSMENSRFRVDVQIDQRTLHEVYLPQYKACVDAGARSIMSAYNSVNGEWCGQNKALLSNILKERWGFTGFVITDWVFGLRNTKKGIENGLDLEMPFHMIWGHELLRLLKKGEVDESLLDRALRRIIAPQFNVPPKENYSKEVLGAAEHKALARESASKSMVLLKNEGNVLPINIEQGAKEDSDQKIVVLGPLAAVPNLGDHGSSDMRPDYVVTPLEGLQKQLGSAVLHFNELSDAGAEEAIKSADTVIVFAGYTHLHEGEYMAPSSIVDFAELVPLPEPLKFLSGIRFVRKLWAFIMRSILKRQMEKFVESMSDNTANYGMGGDRRSLELPPEDEARILAASELNAKTVVAVMGGSAVIMENWRKKVPAIIMLWYPGMEGGHAFADLVLGKQNPSGKLPFVIPTSTSHLPHFEIDTDRIDYGYWHGHRLLKRDSIAPAFPFGFGLGYSAFSLNNLECKKKKLQAHNDSILLSLSVRNEGLYAGDEVVQVYTQAIDSAVERSPIELKAFKRVSLGVGEMMRVNFEIPVEKLAYFDTSADKFTVEAIRYEVIVAKHSEDPDSLKLSISVQ